MGLYLVGEAVGCLQAAATAIAKGGTLSVQAGHKWCLLLLSHVLFAFCENVCLVQAGPAKTMSGVFYCCHMCFCFLQKKCVWLVLLFGP